MTVYNRYPINIILRLILDSDKKKKKSKAQIG